MKLPCSTPTGCEFAATSPSFKWRQGWIGCLVGIRLVLLAVSLVGGTAVANSDEKILGPKRAAIRLPESGAQVQGFTVQVEVGQAMLTGYVPCKIIIQSTGRFPADRRFVFQFRSEPSLESPPQNGLVVDVPIAVTQNTTSETFIRYLPKWSVAQAVGLTVSEDGRPLDGYEAFFGGEQLRPSGGTRFQRRARSRRYLLQEEFQFNWMFLSVHNFAVPASLPDLGSLLVSDAMYGSSGSEFELSDPAERTRFWTEVMRGPSLHAIGQHELPSDWRAYQRYDVIVMDRKALDRLRSLASASETIRHWVLNGGTVVVYNAPTATDVVKDIGFTPTVNQKARESIRTIAYEFTTLWERERSESQLIMEELEQALLDLAQADAQGKDSGESDAGSDATSPSTDAAAAVSDEMLVPFMDEQRILQGITGAPSLSEAQEDLAIAKERLVQLDQALALSVEEWTDQIEVQTAGAGYVIAIKPFAGRETPTKVHWRILATFLDHRRSPTLRRGVDPLIGDRRFARWAIPGVAEPPVYTFIGLLTLFVILVGPVAYRRTTRIGRGYLMFAIAPILALLTTLAMFGYGIVSDGFGTVARIRQLTWVDGASGAAGERVRSTYFAGVRPAAGLRFQGNAELMLYRESSGLSWEDLDNLPTAMLGQVLISNDAQQLDTSFLPSRQQRQFVVHAPRPDIGFLQLIPDPNGIQSPSVFSGFAFPLQTAVIKDERSNYWLVENLAAGKTQQTSPLSTRDASKMLGKLYNDHRPLSEVRETRSTSNRYRDEIYDVILDINRTIGAKATLSDGLFESWLQQYLQTDGELPNQHFVAITDVSQDVLAVDECEIKSSIRYVFGTLR